MATVDIGADVFDTFEDVDGADVYLAGDVLRAPVWAAFDADAKGRGLVSATRLLQTLPLAEPVPTPAADDAPEVLRNVTAMLAADLLADPKLFNDASGNSNVKSVKAGSASVEFFKPVEGGASIPLNLWRLLTREGLIQLGDDSTINDGAIVTGISSGRRPYCGRWAGDYVVSAADHD